jgi:ferritin-like metal-binding protein YciE
MGLFTRDIKSLEDLFKHGLKDIYYAEQQIVKTLPDLIEQTTNAELKRDLKTHLEETKKHVRRLEIVFAALGEEPKGVRCKGIDGILSEGSELISNSDGRSVIEAAVIASAQAVEHYEITRYGDLIAWGRQLGRNDIVKPLRQNLREEKIADRKLTAVAEGRINSKADKSRSRKTRGARSSTRRNREHGHAAP